MIRLFALLFSFTCLVLPATAELLSDRPDPADSKGPVQVRRWTYLSDGLKVKGLLFVPRQARGAKLPAVVFCHDGISGVSKSHRKSSIRLAKAGFVVFAPSYRGEDGSEGSIEIAKGEVRDVEHAIDLLVKLPEVDADHIGIAGASHGSLICALLAARDPRVKAAVLAYGVMDIYRWWDHLKKTQQAGHDPITTRTYGDGPADQPESFRIRNAVAVAPKINCPVLILQGDKDTIVPPNQADLMKAALETNHKSVQVEHYPDALHGFLVYVPYMKDHVEHKERVQTEASWRTFIDFLNKQLRPAPAKAP